MPASLLKDLSVLVDVRMKYRIHIDTHQVLKIRIVAARHRIDGLLRVRDRI